MAQTETIRLNKNHKNSDISEKRKQEKQADQILRSNTGKEEEIYKQFDKDEWRGRYRRSLSPTRCRNPKRRWRSSFALTTDLPPSLYPSLFLPYPSRLLRPSLSLPSTSKPSLSKRPHRLQARFPSLPVASPLSSVPFLPLIPPS